MSDPINDAKPTSSCPKHTLDAFKRERHFRALDKLKASDPDSWKPSVFDMLNMLEGRYGLGREEGKAVVRAWLQALPERTKAAEAKAKKEAWR